MKSLIVRLGIFLAAACASSGAWAQRVSVGSVKLGEFDVDVSFPQAGIDKPTIPGVEWGGQLYPVQGDQLARPRRADGGWGEFLAGYQAAVASPPPQQVVWRQKLWIFRRSDLLSRRDDGVFQFRRSELFRDEFRDVLNAAARFQAMVLGTTGGKVKVQLDLEVEEETIRAELGPGMTGAFDHAFVENVLGPRTNSYNFETDDPTYRGPYHGIFVVHPGLVDPVALDQVHEIPVSLISYFTRSTLADSDRLALSLFASWVRQVSWAAQRAGYRTPVLKHPFDNPFLIQANQILADSLWNSISFVEPSTGPWSERRFRPEGPQPTPWSAGNPWTSLPQISRSRAHEMFTNLVDASLDGNSDLSIFSSSGLQIAVPAWKAEVVLSKSLPKYAPAALGFVEGTFTNLIVFQLLQAPSEQQEIELFGMKPVKQVSQQENPIQLETFPTQERFKAVVEQEGRLDVAQVADPDVGNVIEVTERGAYRSGLVDILDGGQGGVDLATTPQIEFKYKTTGRDPFALRFDFVTNKRGYLVLGPRATAPYGSLDRKEPAIGIPVSTLNQWITVSANLAELFKAAGTSKVWSVSIVPEPYYEYFERQETKATIADFTVPQFGPAKAGEEATPPQASRGEFFARLRQAAAATTADEETVDLLKSMLNESNRLVRLQAIEALTRIKVPSLVRNLAEEMKSGTSWNAFYAAKALIFQGTDEAKLALREPFEIGPYDHNRWAAAKAVTTLSTDEFAGSVSLLYAARGWSVRKAAVESLASMPGREPALILVTFLREVESIVRLAVVKNADPQYELVSRRLLYASVNDPSEEIRALATEKLIRRAGADVQIEAAKNLKDESPWVRRTLLQSLAKDPVLSMRQPIVAALKDSVASVQSEAIRALCAMTQPITAEELVPVLKSIDPRVHSALLSLVTGKKLAVSPEIKQVLLNSADPAVRAEAQKW
ncbi:MAG: HEAT repeat domain-containing protein [Armatimonadetes bacterium]|nr:HEAT repeat domain-containing protein [Armatimonadota bacterium]